MASKPNVSMPGTVVAAIAIERARISSILESDAGKLSPAVAIELALRSNLDADTAIGILAKSAPDNPYLIAMSREGNVGISAHGNLTNHVASDDPRAARLAEIAGSMKQFNKVQGYSRER